MMSVFLVCVWCLVISFAYAIPSCPSISNVIYTSPYCECKYGPAYDEITNTCPNPECPPTSIAQPSYPNCTCTEVNFSYNEYLNECVRVCPENSTGYWPNCVCDDKLTGFDKHLFKCVRCPEDSIADSVYPNCDCDGQYNKNSNTCMKCIEGSTGVYPNCTCNDENAVFIASPYSSQCQTCPHNSSGKVPNCVCDNGAKYYETVNECAECPFDSTGTYPNCECLDDGYFDGEFCRHCPYGAIGLYPNCTCEEMNATYVGESNLCMNCPSDSTGIYPSCECSEPLHYDREQNICLQCPENADGTYPNCVCKTGYYYYNASNVCIDCPANSTGVYPNCECSDKYHVFSAYINECYIPCKGGSTGIGKHPYCNCDSGMFYKADEFQCKSNVGRECPPVSIGIGPDCLCIEKDKRFFESFWSCNNKYVSWSFVPPIRCPDRSQKYPQCSGIDPNALKSLVG